VRSAGADVNNSQLFLSILHQSQNSHRAAAASGREVLRECPKKTYFSALPLLATNSGDATARATCTAAVAVAVALYQPSGLKRTGCYEILTY